MRLKHRLLAVAVLLACGSTAPAQAPPFFQSKTITIIVGFSPGGLYDLTARALARELGHHIDGNPSVIVENKAGSGGTTALAYLFHGAPQDGTVLGMIKRSYATDAPFDAGGFKYDPTALGAIGSTSREVSVAVAWYTSKVKRFEDTFTTELSVGATAASDGTVRYANLVKKLTPAKLKIVPGYPRGQRNNAGDGARRSRCKIRLVVGERQKPRTRFAADEANQHPVADGIGEGA